MTGGNLRLQSDARFLNGKMHIKYIRKRQLNATDLNLISFTSEIIAGTRGGLRFLRPPSTEIYSLPSDELAQRVVVGQEPSGQLDPQTVFVDHLGPESVAFSDPLVRMSSDCLNSRYLRRNSPAQTTVLFPVTAVQFLGYLRRRLSDHETLSGHETVLLSVTAEILGYFGHNQSGLDQTLPIPATAVLILGYLRCKLSGHQMVLLLVTAVLLVYLGRKTVVTVVLLLRLPSELPPAPPDAVVVDQILHICIHLPSKSPINKSYRERKSNEIMKKKKR
ncbi:hypothetical protein Ccrd_023700 [Cynara cardunculus var. scolymus]|uniref:Uncharacterized protein n=1 Tax=Cynara cardunculus var. scolymus TaxID=59895 RepID=A0A103XWA8_CYNCS|nr:hypothetical protein Ccrd_023700 [Cynara cardunculus var. scolymus]